MIQVIEGQAEGQEKIIKKQDELIDYMLSLLQC